MTITLTPEIEHALHEQARQQGTTPELLALSSLRERFVKSAPAPEAEEPITLYDALQGLIGTVHSGEHIPGGAQMATDSGRKFARGMMAKRAAGKL